MSAVILSGSDELSTLYLARTLYPHVEFKWNWAEVGEIFVHLIPAGRMLAGLQVDRVILLDDGEIKNIEEWTGELRKRLAPDGRLFVIEHFRGTENE